MGRILHDENGKTGKPGLVEKRGRVEAGVSSHQPEGDSRGWFRMLNSRGWLV